MSTNSNRKKELYPIKDVAVVVCGIPVVATVAVLCANFVTSYAGI